MSNRVEYPDGRGRRAPSCYLNCRPRSLPGSGESLGRGRRAPSCYLSRRSRISGLEEGQGRGRRAPGKQGVAARALSFTLLEMPFSGLSFSDFWSSR